jgi:anti-anti-sigma factor
MALRHLRVRWSNEIGRTVVHLHGDVDAATRPDLDAIGVVADGVPQVVVDLDDVGYIDAIGVDLLEGLARRSNVEVRHPSAPLVRLLRRTDGVIADWTALRLALADDLH